MDHPPPQPEAEVAHAAVEELVPAVYEELRRLARRERFRLSGGYTLTTTALIHEAYIRLSRSGFATHGDFLRVAAVAMRRILVDHARQRATAKRGGAAQRVALTDVDRPSDPFDMEILELDELISRLAVLDSATARVVELRFFAGMSNEEIAAALGIARSTVAEYWSVARAWMRAQLGQGERA